MIEFKRIIRKTRFLDPRQGFAAAEVPSEVRFDPLTGQTGRVAHFLPDKLPPPDLTPWQQFAASYSCPFCPENVERVTPKFPAEIFPEGRLRRGEALIFPNLSPYDEYSAVTVITAAHSPALADFTAEQLFDAFAASLAFLARVTEGRPDLRPFVCWNYLPPSGSSQLHPHLQAFASTVAGNALEVELRAEAAYRQRHGRSFWADLLEEEKARGERYLGRVGRTEWLVAFRPYGVLGDVLALFPEGKLLPRLEKELLAAMIAGLQRLFAFLQDINVISFNLALYQGAEGTRLRFTPRLYIQPALHTSDVNSLQMVCGEPIAMVAPEDIAARIKPYFATSGA